MTAVKSQSILVQDCTKVSCSMIAVKPQRFAQPRDCRNKSHSSFSRVFCYNRTQRITYFDCATNSWLLPCLRRSYYVGCTHARVRKSLRRSSTSGVLTLEYETVFYPFYLLCTIYAVTAERSQFNRISTVSGTNRISTVSGSSPVSTG